MENYPTVILYDRVVTKTSLILLPQTDPPLKTEDVFSPWWWLALGVRSGWKTRLSPQPREGERFIPISPPVPADHASSTRCLIRWVCGWGEFPQAQPVFHSGLCPGDVFDSQWPETSPQVCASHG